MKLGTDWLVESSWGGRATQPSPPQTRKIVDSETDTSTRKPRLGNQAPRLGNHDSETGGPRLGHQRRSRLGNQRCPETDGLGNQHTWSFFIFRDWLALGPAFGLPKGES